MIKTQNINRYHFMAKVIPFLATPIMTTGTDFRLTDNEMNYVLENFSDDTNTGFKTGAKLSSNVHLLEMSEMKRVHDFIVESVKVFVKDSLKITDEFYLTNSWATTNSKGDKHHIHHHPNTLLSAVYYPHVESGNLKFYSEKNGLFPNFDFSFNYSEYNEFNSKSWTIAVKSGDLVIFPGWLKHETTPNEHDSLRVMIGANFFTRGAFGSDKTLDLLEVK